MHAPLLVRERSASLFDEETACIRECDNPSLVASAQERLTLCFEFDNLFAERRLGDMQPVRGASEVQLFGQDDDCPQVTRFDPRKHRSTPLSPKTAEGRKCPLYTKEQLEGQKQQKKIWDERGKRICEVQKYFDAFSSDPGGFPVYPPVLPPVHSPAC